MAIFAIIFVLIVLIGEILLCRYLDNAWHGEPHTLVPSAVIFLVLASLACCRSICISTHADFFGLLGAGTIAFFVVALCAPLWPSGEGSWKLALPPAFTAVGLLLASMARFWRASCVLSRIERMLRFVEIVAFIFLSAAFVVLSWALVPQADGQLQRGSTAVLAGSVAGVSICAIAALHGGMAIAEGRSSLVRDRLVAYQAVVAPTPLTNGSSGDGTRTF